MPRSVVIIGAGMGGLTAAIRLARAGHRVTVIERREQPGGLASGLTLDGFPFDAGPYILLDRPGLEWAFRSLDLELDEHVSLDRVRDVYEVADEERSELRMFDSVVETARGIDRKWPGSGARYESFVRRTASTYRCLQPLQWKSRPSPRDLLATGAWRKLPFLLRSLHSVLRQSRLPPPVIAALGIWTHVAGQTMDAAPSPLALVPAVIHTHGAYYPRGGIGAIPQSLYSVANELGVEFQFAAAVERIRCKHEVAVGVDTEDGTNYPADAVISNVGLKTYLTLLDEKPVGHERELDKLASLPLQSPGVCVYLAVKGRPTPPYLRFHLRNERDGCRLLVCPAVLQPELTRDGWSPARLIAPMNHERAEADSGIAQQAFLDKVLEENWWRGQFEKVRVLATRKPGQWGDCFGLYRNSMNPVMTARFMRSGRLAHRSPWIRRLYLAGSATHPGQWVSFAAVSGVLASLEVLRDFSRSRS